MITRDIRLMKYWKNLKMSYKINFSETSLKQLRKLDNLSRKRILNYVSDVLTKIENPRILGKALTGDLKGLWRYRIGNFRIVCQIQDNSLLILILKIAHRKEIYLS